MSEWKEYKLGEVLSIKYGKDHKQLQEGVYPVYGSGGVMRYADRFIYDDESILIPRKGSLNNIFYENKAFWTVDTMFWSVINKNKAYPKFLYYQLTLVDFENLNVGSAVPSLTIPTINEVDISLPSLDTQRRIAAILSSLDDKIDLLHRENATLEQMAETLFKELVLNKENEGTIEQIVSIQNGYAFKSKDFKDVGAHKVIKIKNISDSIVNIDTTDFVDDNAIIGLSPKFKINGGDILIAMTGAEIGKLGIIPKNDKSLWLNQRVGLLVEKFKGSKYLAYLQLKSDFGQDYIENTATGSAQPNISGVGIEKCGFPIFKQEDLIQISLQIGELYDKIIFNLGQINVLKDTRDFLLPKLMNNEIKI